jgi:hypothetical protein
MHHWHAIYLYLTFIQNECHASICHSQSLNKLTLIDYLLIHMSKYAWMDSVQHYVKAIASSYTEI